MADRVGQRGLSASGGGGRGWPRRAGDFDQGVWFLLLTGFLVLVAGVVGLFVELDSAATAAALVSGAALCGLAAVLFSMASPRQVGTASLMAETLFDYTDAKARLAAMDMPDELRDPFRRMARGEAAAAYLEVVQPRHGDDRRGYWRGDADGEPGSRRRADRGRRRLPGTGVARLGRGGSLVPAEGSRTLPPAGVDGRSRHPGAAHAGAPRGFLTPSRGVAGNRLPLSWDMTVPGAPRSNRCHRTATFAAECHQFGVGVGRGHPTRTVTLWWPVAPSGKTPFLVSVWVSPSPVVARTEISCSPGSASQSMAHWRHASSPRASLSRVSRQSPSSTLTSTFPTPR